MTTKMFGDVLTFGGILLAIIAHCQARDYCSGGRYCDTGYCCGGGYYCCSGGDGGSLWWVSLLVFLVLLGICVSVGCYYRRRKLVTAQVPATTVFTTQQQIPNAGPVVLTVPQDSTPAPPYSGYSTQPPPNQA